MAHAKKRDLFFQRNGRVHLNWLGVSLQSTTGSRGVHISSSNGSNAGYTMLWSSVQDYWLPTPLASFPFTSLIVYHRVPSSFNWALPDVVRSTARSATLTQDSQDWALQIGRRISRCAVMQLWGVCCLSGFCLQLDFVYVCVCDES